MPREGRVELEFNSPDQSTACTEQQCSYQNEFAGFDEFAQKDALTLPLLAGCGDGDGTI